MERRRTRLAQLLRFAVAAGALAAAPVSATDWKYVTTSGLGSVIYADHDSARGSNGVGTVWTKWDHSKNAHEKAHYSIIQYRVDCNASTMTVLSYIDYAANNEIISSRTYPTYEQKPSPIAPDTVGMDLKQLLCG